MEKEEDETKVTTLFLSDTWISTNLRFVRTPGKVAHKSQVRLIKIVPSY